MGQPSITVLLKQQYETSLPKFIVAGVSSGAGKTLVATAIMYYFQRKGFHVQPFKIGPDFIDPSYHAVVCRRQSYNLDIWMMGERGVLSEFSKISSDADIAVIEGVMGLFDGVAGKSDFGSTAHVARILNAPIILVIDASRAGGSVAALAYGFLNFDKRLDILGIVLNNVASQKHLNTIIEALRSKMNIPILGVITKNKDLVLRERHLGLIPVLETRGLIERKIVRTSRLVSKELSLRGLRSFHVTRKISESLPSTKHSKPAVRIAIAKDESFNFYYPDTAESLELNNAEVVYFSPVNDKKLPDAVSGIILGGGFPEILADELAQNHYIKKSILREAERGMPIYAECGGLMYLTKTITVYHKGKREKKKMIGLIEADTSMDDKLTLNYTEAENSGAFFRDIKKIRGHEFHYSRIHNIDKDLKFAYALRRGNGIFNKKDGLIVYNCLASYMHLHFGGD
ncbi:MAG TPA: cobyrinate a,c-diamide synthase, partial [Nitrososphaeraceae archaeon]|nr:cobyrinate a,c-diamide synthase [Nitrososphaeraceae archaeon]